MRITRVGIILTERNRLNACAYRAKRIQKGRGVGRMPMISGIPEGVRSTASGANENMRKKSDIASGKRIR
ncbi:MAG: hypothetical protein A2Y36_15735 [Treponema sp. GWA1_62_8]|nr:MAG: hypothetical protein A2Y36_15735 [Treponema sp. GWA1_62_8]